MSSDSPVVGLHHDFGTFTESVISLSDALIDFGHVVHNHRTGQDITEVLSNTFTVRSALSRHLCAENRNNNPFAAIVETMWVLRGRNDTKTLLPYLPRANQFADDGKHWRAGYGPRLRSYGGVDQLRTVVRILKILSMCS